MENRIRPGIMVRLKYDHPSAGVLFRVAEQIQARGFYRLYFSYQVDTVTRFKVIHTVIAHEDEFEVVD